MYKISLHLCFPQAVITQNGRGRSPARSFRTGHTWQPNRRAGNSGNSSVPWEWGKYEDGRVQRGTHTLAPDRPTDHCCACTRLHKWADRHVSYSLGHAGQLNVCTVLCITTSKERFILYLSYYFFFCTFSSLHIKSAAHAVVASRHTICINV